MTVMSAEVLQSLVSRVTEVALGLPFELEPAGSDPDPSWPAALIPVPGEDGVTVSVSADLAGCRELGGRMFACPPDQVDGPMGGDTLCELANIIAGQVKSTLSLREPLGLPRLVERGFAREGWEGASLRSGATVMWVGVRK